MHNIYESLLDVYMTEKIMSRGLLCLGRVLVTHVRIVTYTINALARLI